RGRAQRDARRHRRSPAHARARRRPASGPQRQEHLPLPRGWCVAGLRARRGPDPLPGPARLAAPRAQPRAPAALAAQVAHPARPPGHREPSRTPDRARGRRHGTPAVSRVAMDRVCIVMMSAVGDAVHVLPLLNALKRQRPDMHVTWVLQPGPAMLVRGHPGVDEIILFDRSRGWRGFADVRRALRARAFDLVIALQVYFKAGLITSFTRAPVKLGFERARA